MQRYDLINCLNQKHFGGNADYLEIGVSDPKCNFNKIKTPNKSGIDAGFEYRYTDQDNLEFGMTSNEFFELLENGTTRFPKDHKWDIIFIDGLHLAAQVLRDVENSLNHINDNGYIILHDCSPISWETAHSDIDYYYATKKPWNGTSWKALYYLRTTTDQLIQTIDTDCGLGVITMNKKGEKIDHYNTFFDYGIMNYDRKKALGLISVYEFMSEHIL